jgi:hypothetical protein
MRAATRTRRRRTRDQPRAIGQGSAPPRGRAVWQSKIAKAETVQKQRKTATDRRQPPGRNGFKYRPQFAVIVVCKDEAAHRATFDKLKRAGYRKLRVVSV